MRRAISYLRFSSPEQAKGDSLRRQLKLTEALAKKHGWILDEGLTLRDLGVSAFKGANAKDGALKLFLESVSAGWVPKGSVLVVESLDRISRQEEYESLHLVMGILRAGIAIATVSPEDLFEPDEKSQMMSAMKILLILSRAHEESKTKQGRGKEAWDSRRKNAPNKPITGRCPEWLKLTPDGFKEIKERADAVRLAYKLCREGMGVQRVTKTLTENGAKPFGRSGKWHMSYVRKLLTFRAVMGEFQMHVMNDGKRVPIGEPIPDYFPAIVSEADFYQAQTALTKRKGHGRAGKSEANLLTGLVWHAGDKATMLLKRPTGDDKYLYLSSSAYLNGKRSKGPAGFPYKLLEAAILRTVKRLRPADVTDRPKDDFQQGIDKAKAELDVIVGRLEDAKRRAEKVENPKDADPFYDMMVRFQKQKRQKEEELERLKAAAVADGGGTLEETKTLVGMLATAKGDKLAQLRRRLKARLQILVKEGWVLIEQFGRMKVAQVQVHLHAGGMRPVVVVHPESAPLPEGFAPYTGDLREYQGATAPRT
jgi:DNA invertase Pin-like site-specific DNA recombinase